MTSINIKMELPEEFLSDILITAFDGTYGWSWEWFEPVGGDWLSVKKDEGHTSSTNPWMSVRVRLREMCLTGDKILDRRDGFTIGHEDVARAISAILNDEYLNASEHETARGYREDLAKCVANTEMADIDGPYADAIIQVAALGKVVFG